MDCGRCGVAFHDERDCVQVGLIGEFAAIVSLDSRLSSSPKCCSEWAGSDAKTWNRDMFYGRDTPKTEK